MMMTTIKDQFFKDFLMNFSTFELRYLSLKILHHTVFENHRKSLIHHYERSELRLHFELTKVN